MQFPQKNENNELLRGICTPNIEELSHFQVNKNRHYTQLQAGKLSASYIEVNLGKVQLFREQLSTGVRIEASPAKKYVPFGSIFPSSGDYRYCGKNRSESAIMQATGGHWDICFRDKLDYICAAFDRSSMNHDVEQLTGSPLPDEWLESRLVITPADAHLRYLQGISTIIIKVQAQPTILNNSNAVRMINADILTLALDTLAPTGQLNGTLKPPARRIRGVRRVIDYLNVHASLVPSIPELCSIAKLSERSLEYGFREYLDITPIAYLRLLRLNGARRDLLANTNANANVSDVALRWGFVEFGRFAREYRLLFEELPSETMRNNNR